MYPFVSLSLTDAEEKPLNLLSWVLSEVEQDEQQFVSRVLQMGAYDLRHIDGNGES